jgi:hypothetical protein
MSTHKPDDKPDPHDKDDKASKKKAPEPDGPPTGPGITEPDPEHPEKGYRPIPPDLNPPAKPVQP